MEAVSMSEALQISLVIADDHNFVRKGIRSFLERDTRLKVIGEASDGDEAIKLARELRPQVLVLDVQMPGKTGIDVTRIVRSEQLPMGILILTAYNDEPFVMSALKAGANGYVLKIAEPEELSAAVHEVHEGNRVLDTRIPHHEELAAAAMGDARSNSDPLSPREIRVLQLVAAGYTNKAIGSQLGISDRTVQAHLATIFDKLGAKSRTEAVMIGLRNGIISASAD
jgi:DNA-binding NarL/FixJ family response regulator